MYDGEMFHVRPDRGKKSIIFIRGDRRKLIPSLNLFCKTGQLYENLLRKSTLSQNKNQKKRNKNKNKTPGTSREKVSSNSFPSSQENGNKI